MTTAARSALLLAVASAAVLVTGCHKGDERMTRQAALIDQDDKFNREPNPEINPQTHYAAGLVAESRNDLAGAIAQYERALEGNPQHAPTLHRLALLQTGLKRYEEATVNWRRYVQATGGTAIAWSNLGYCLDLAENVPEAEAAYREAISRNLTLEAAHVNLGLMLARVGRLDDAQTALAAVLPPNQVAYNIGSVAQQHGDVTTARRFFKQALDLEPAWKAPQERLAALPIE